MDKLASELSVGDIYTTRRGDTIYSVEIVGPKEDASNQFGLPWFKFLATTQGRTGYVTFGPKATVALEEKS